MSEPLSALRGHWHCTDDQDAGSLLESLASGTGDRGQWLLTV